MQEFSRNKELFPLCGDGKESVIAKKLQHVPIFCFRALRNSFEAMPLWESIRFGALGRAHCGAAEVAKMQQRGQQHTAS